MIFYLNLVVILIFTFLICLSQKYSRKKTFLISLLITFTPIVWNLKINYFELIIFSLLSLIVVFSEKSKNKIVYLFFSIIILAFSLLYVHQIINFDFKLNFERTFIYDQKQINIIKDFEKESTYLLRARKYIYGNWIIIANILKKFFLYFWFQNISIVLGIVSIIPLTIGFIKKNNYFYVLSIIIGVIAGTMSRNPNISIIFYLISPFLINLIIKGSSFLKNKTIISLIIINFILLITAR